MLLTGDCKQCKYLLVTEMSPCLAQFVPELDPKLDFPMDLQLCHCDAQHCNVQLWVQLQSFTKSWEKRMILGSFQP